LALPPSTPAVLVSAEEKDGPAYRVGFQNFYAISRYNHSARYAMAVNDAAEQFALTGCSLHMECPPRMATALLLTVLLSACSTLPPQPQSPSTVAPSVPAPPSNVTAIPDAIPKLEPRSAHGNPPFYDVLGRRYY